MVVNMLQVNFMFSVQETENKLQFKNSSKNIVDQRNALRSMRNKLAAWYVNDPDAALWFVQSSLFKLFLPYDTCSII